VGGSDTRQYAVDNQNQIKPAHGPMLKSSRINVKLPQRGAWRKPHVGNHWPYVGLI